jgi:hypothetical protein
MWHPSCHLDYTAEMTLWQLVADSYSAIYFLAPHILSVDHSSNIYFYRLAVTACFPFFILYTYYTKFITPCQELFLVWQYIYYSFST